MIGSRLRRWITTGLAAWPDRGGVKFLLRLRDRLDGFTLGVIKRTEGNAHPRHRVTDAPDFFRNEVHAGDTVLDVGSAYGHNATAMASRAGRVVGIEPRPEAVARARAERPAANVEYRVGTLATLDPAERFDVIVLGNVLEHITDRAAFLAACRRHGRKLLVRVPAIDRDWMVPYRRELGMRWTLHPDHAIEYTIETLRDELTAAGFRVTSCVSRFGALQAVAVREGEA